MHRKISSSPPPPLYKNHFLHSKFSTKRSLLLQYNHQKWVSNRSTPNSVHFSYSSLSLLLITSNSYKRYEQHEQEDESPEAELFECFLRCDKPRGNEHELTGCEQKCVDHYQERKRQEREEGGTGGGDEWSYVQIEEPWKVYERCQRGCDKQQGSSLQDQCRRTCRDLYGEMKKHHRQERHGKDDCGCGRVDCRCGGAENHHEPIEERYKQCRSRCGRQEHGQQRQLCEHRCKWQFEKQQRERGGGDETNPGKEYEQERESRNPYLFEKQRFNTKFKTEQGHIKLLPRFSKKSDLLQGIDNYRLAILEANPNTFVLPHHSDAESIFFVVGGELS